MTEDENDRGKILSLARMVAGVGGIGVLVVQIAQALGTAFVNKIDKNAADYDTLVQKANQKGFIVTVIIMTVIASVLLNLQDFAQEKKLKRAREVTHSRKTSKLCLEISLSGRFLFQAF